MLGIDEISRNRLNINAAEGMCHLVRAGRMHVNVMYREDWSVKVIIADSMMTLEKGLYFVGMKTVKRQGIQ